MAVSLGMTQGLACVPTHRSYVGMKTRRNQLFMVAPAGSGEVFLWVVLYGGIPTAVSVGPRLRFKGV